MNFLKKFLNPFLKMNVLGTNLRVKSMAMVMVLIGLTAMSCKEDPNTKEDSDTIRVESSTPTAPKKSNILNPESELVLTDYMTLKNALVETDKSTAAEAGKKLEKTLKSFTVDKYPAEQQDELKTLVTSAIQHSEKIAQSEMEEQRANFQKLNDDITGLVAITGTEHTLYEQFCPMYGEGGAWLSTEKNIRNPYFGSKMMKCGVVQKEIN